MAARKPSKKNDTPDRQARQEEKKRWQLAQTACRTMADALFAWQRDAGPGAPETARQYCAMMAVHYRKLRNGQVLGPADFGICVEVARHALRMLQALDPAMTFDGEPQGEALRAAGQAAGQVLDMLRRLQAGSTRPR